MNNSSGADRGRASLPGLPRRRGRRWVVLAGAVIVSCVIAGVIWWVLGGAQALQSRTVSDLLSNTESIHPKQETSSLCNGEVVICEEGWTTDVGDYLRFNTAGEAEYWEIVLGDSGRRNDRIVLDMTGYDLTFDEKRRAIDVLFSDRDWS